MTDAEKREKVVERLKELQSHFRSMAGISSSKQGRASYIARTIGDAIALLKAQEPRVMTLEDLWSLKFNDTVILEQKIPSLLIPAIVRDNIKHDDALEVLQVVTASTNGTANADYEYYGKTWRCWTSRPSDGQRKEIPWE